MLKLDNLSKIYKTGTFGGLTPVTKIDGRVIGTGQPGAMTEKLTALYKAEVQQAVQKAKEAK